MSELNTISKVSGLVAFGKNLPVYLVLVALGFFIAFGFKNAKETIAAKGGLDSAAIAQKFDSIFKALQNAERPSITYVTEVQSGKIVDSAHDCWGSATILFGSDTVTIDSANSCKGMYRGARLKRAPLMDSSQRRALDSLRALAALLLSPSRLPLFSGIGGGNMNPLGDRPITGYEIEARFGTSLPGNMMGAVDVQGWLGRYGLFATPRLVLPEFAKSSIDLGVSYKFW